VNNIDNNHLPILARIGYWASLLTIVFIVAHAFLYYPVIKAGVGPVEKFNVESYAMTMIKNGIFTNGFLPQAAAFIAGILFLATSACLYIYVPLKKKIFALLSLSFGIISVTLGSMAYFANWTCFPRSALAGDFSGLAQYAEGNINSFVFAMLILSFHIFTSFSIILLAPIFTLDKKNKFLGILFIIIGLSAVPSIISLATGIFPLLFIHDGIVTIALIWASILLLGYWKGIEKRPVTECTP
jgi:hypothetical protein